MSPDSSRKEGAGDSENLSFVVVSSPESELAGRYSVHADSASFATESASLRKTLSHPSARDLLLAALGTCAAGLVQQALMESGLKSPAVEVRVACEKPAGTPPAYKGWAVDIRIKHVDAATARMACEAFIVSCPILNALRHSSCFNVNVVVDGELVSQQYLPRLTPTPESHNDGTLIDVETAHRAILDGVAAFDLRWLHRREADGEIPGVSAIDRADVLNALREVSQEQRVLLICNTEHGSLEAARTLEAAGYTDVVHVAGGFQAWREAGLPIVQHDAK